MKEDNKERINRCRFLKTATLARIASTMPAGLDKAFAAESKTDSRRPSAATVKSRSIACNSIRCQCSTSTETIRKAYAICPLTGSDTYKHPHREYIANIRSYTR